MIVGERIVRHSHPHIQTPENVMENLHVGLVSLGRWDLEQGVLDGLPDVGCPEVLPIFHDNCLQENGESWQIVSHQSQTILC